jgi:hypothetical protein
MVCTCTVAAEGLEPPTMVTASGEWLTTVPKTAVIPDPALAHPDSRTTAAAAREAEEAGEDDALERPAAGVADAGAELVAGVAQEAIVRVAARATVVVTAERTSRCPGARECGAWGGPPGAWIG